MIKYYYTFFSKKPWFGLGHWAMVTLRNYIFYFTLKNFLISLNRLPCHNQQWTSECQIGRLQFTAILLPLISVPFIWQLLCTVAKTVHNFCRSACSAWQTLFIGRPQWQRTGSTAVFYSVFKTHNCCIVRCTQCDVRIFIDTICCQQQIAILFSCIVLMRKYICKSQSYKT